MKINLTVPTTSNKLELFVKISGGLEESPWKVEVDGTPFISVYISWIDDTYGYSIILASPDQSKPLSDYTSGAVSLIGIVPAGETRHVSAVCLTNQQDLTHLRIIAQSENENYTSTLYPVIFSDEISLTFPSILEKIIPVWRDSLGMNLSSIDSGSLKVALTRYNNWEPEVIELFLPQIDSGILRQILKRYENWPPEELELTLPSIDSGTLRTILIRYQNWIPESIELTLPSITSGSLT